MTRKLTLAITTLILIPLVPGLATADIDLDEEGKLKLSIDFRFRLEADWDSQRADGRERDDRDRARIRGRLGLTYRPTDILTLGMRVRTGSQDSQQSSHITIHDFDDNPRGDEDVLLDKWYVRFENDKAWGWAGRNSFPYWKPNEFFWDDDVTPAGVAVGYTPVSGDSTLSLIGGYFTLPDGGVDFGPEMAAAQLVCSASAGATDFTVAGGFFGLDGSSGIELLRNGNGSRDYSIWVANLQARLEAGGRPLKLGLDLMHNAESYNANDPDPFTVANRNETDGWDVYVSWGSTGKKGDWLTAVYYAHIETLAVNASFAQDDWIRWGSATQTDSSDLEGFELRAAYALTAKMNLVARLYLVEAITSRQDGNRFRIDYNVKF